MIRLRWPWKRRTMGVRVELEQTKQLPLLGERGGVSRNMVWERPLRPGEHPKNPFLDELPLLVVKPGVGSLWHSPDCTTPRPESPCRCGKVNLEWP